MADPVSIGMMALSAGGKIFGGIAANKAGKKNKRMLYAQAQAESNAGVQQELQLREGARAAMGEQVAGQFSNGFLGGSGSALDALHQSQVNSAMDVLNARTQWMGKAASLRQQGDQEAAAGKSALIGSLFSAAGGALKDAKDWGSAQSGQSSGGSGSGGGGSSGGGSSGGPAASGGS